MDTGTAHRAGRILTLTCFGHYVSHVNMLVFPALVLPLAARLQLPMGQVLGLSFWMYLLFGLTALPWGVLADRWGARPLLALFFAGAAGCAVAAAFWIDHPLRLSVALAGLGLFSGIYHPTGLGWISREVERVSRGMAYNGMAGNLGLASAPLLAGVLNFGWGAEAVYLALGALNLAGLVLVLSAPGTARTPGERSERAPGAAQAGGFVILLGAMMLGGVIYRGATVSLPACLEIRNAELFLGISQMLGVSLSPNVMATSISSAIYLLGMVGQYAGGSVAERHDLRWCYLGFHLVVLPAGLAMAWTAELPLVLLTMVYLFFLLGMQPIENTLVARLTPKRLHHAAYGTKFLLTFGVGALAVKLAAAVEVVAGIGMIFAVLGGVSVVLLCMIAVLIARTQPMSSAAR